ncbi:hypothetical protein JIR001_06780 [Polycladomyces abyssicola]|jgi:hypothetical protein|uniref:DUF3899 domain-containing protein n=1 Tax=Polycladomyces abyssicola TaxID=1125966 RepID=A0A8D5ZLS4_9BACL|nr:DUF3899 domain-containing protein [Polycladomyces abyssicola]BCU80895.1 hypothetical protein JIR001_06780 [Polycladomyces abyssicola]
MHRMRPWQWSLILMIGSWLIVALISHTQKLEWINGLFLFGLGFLMVSGSAYVIRGGFFSLFVRSLRKWLQPPELEDWGEETDSERTKRLEWIVPAFLMAGLVDTTLSFALVYI